MSGAKSKRFKLKKLNELNKQQEKTKFLSLNEQIIFLN